MLDAYCWPLSAAPERRCGSMRRATSVPARSSRADGPKTTWSGAPTRRGGPAPHTRPRQRERLWLAGHDRDPARSRVGSGYYAVTLTAGAERADACFVVRPRADEPPRSCSCSPPPRGTPTTTGWAVPVHRRTRVSFERPFAKGFLVKPDRRPHDADHARPRGDRLSELGAATGAVRLGRRRGWWNWERPFLHWAESTATGWTW